MDRKTADIVPTEQQIKDAKMLCVELKDNLFSIDDVAAWLAHRDAEIIKPWARAVRSADHLLAEMIDKVHTRWIGRIDFTLMQCRELLKHMVGGAV